MKKILLTFILVGIFSVGFVGSGSFDQEDNRLIGYEFLDNNSVVHIWNNATISDYFFEKDSGIQLTNHYEDYWTRNIFCLGYYSGAEWVKIKCADELTNFEKTIESDDSTYVNATLWKDIEHNGYNLRFGIQYHLGLNDENLSITIYMKNIGVNIPYDLGFAWKVTNLDVPPETTDKILINNTRYGLDGNYDLTFKNMKKIIQKYNITGYENITNETGNITVPIYEVINETVKIPFYKIYDYETGLTGKENFLRIDWDENLNYAVKMYGNGNQSNFYTALLINAGQFNAGQEKSTTFYWIDALTDNIDAYFKLDDTFYDELGVYNGTNAGTSFVSGKINNGSDFEKTETDWIDVADYSPDIADFTSCLWFNAETSAATIQAIYNLAFSGSTYGFKVLYLYNDGIYADMGGGGFQYNYLGTGEWKFVCVVRDSSASKALMYVDGVNEVNGSIGSSSAAGSNYMILGADRNHGTHYDGILDEIGFWSRALTPAEVTELWNSGNGYQYPFTPVDTCTYDTGNWNVECSDYCNITDVTSLPSNNLTLNGTGTFTILANITADMVIMDTNCQVNNLAGDGKKLMVV